MFPPFPTKDAHRYNLELIDDLNSGDVILKQITEVSAEREGAGVMLGTLVCQNSDGQEVVLHGVSGIAKQLELKEKSATKVVVPPIASPAEINKALSKNDKEIHRLTDLINAGEGSDSITEGSVPLYIQQRTKLCAESLQLVFDLYEFTCFNGKKISLNEIIKAHGDRLPPTGTGDCCAPKLLSYAFEHNLQPISMDEVFFGRNTKNKINGESYGPCDERCGYILPWILGLEILYRDEDILVVNKQSGLLSVPGRGEDKQDCLVTRMQRLFPDTIKQPSVHRLDMETSGLVVLAFNAEAHRNLNAQFADGNVHKKYVALLEGVLNKADGNYAPKKGEKTGRIELKFRLDPDNRPHQIYDEEYGKLGITDWENIGTETYRFTDATGKEQHFPATRVIYTPQTGRTHQLRLHSADKHGFGLPIIGDTLYGNWQEGQRLMLHSFELEFNHPKTGERLKFECKADF